MYDGLHPRSNVERLYLTRSKGGRGLVSIEDCVSDKRKSLALYALGSDENLINAATPELNLKNFINIPSRQEKKKQCLVEWEEKAPHGQFLRETEGTDDGDRWK